MSDILIRRRAKISDCGRYRYWLSREWGPGPMLTFVMLNPSTADDQIDDPTIRRCIGFAKREGADGCDVVNLYGLRSTDPYALTVDADPIGPGNAEAVGAALIAAAVSGFPVVCGWGAYQAIGVAQVAKLVECARDCGVRLVCLGRTVKRAPRHPLYVRADTPFELYP